MAIVFVYGQIKFEQILTPWFSDNLSQGATELGKLKTDLRYGRSAGENKSVTEPGKPATVAGESATEPEESATLFAKVLAHLVVGLPAVLGYMLLAPYTKKRFREKARADMQRQDYAGADPSAARKSEAAPIASAIEVHDTGYATFARRTAAHQVDWVVCGFLLVLFAVLLAAIGADSDMAGTALWVLIPWLYRATTLASKHQATLGMRLAGVFATDVKGRRLSFLRATARHFASFLSYYLVFLGFLMQPFNKKRQTLHDRLSGTVVLRRPSKKLDPLAPRDGVASPDGGLIVKTQ
jgi:uncharacterized RDD family membrane protein YckC